MMACAKTAILIESVVDVETVAAAAAVEAEATVVIDILVVYLSACVDQLYGIPLTVY